MALLDELGDRGRLRAAWQDVEANRGMPGIDRVTIASYGAELERNLDELAGEVREGRYRPQPVLRIRPPFLAESDRALVVPTVRDRVLQRTVVDLLRPLIEPTLTDACVAFRKGSSATRAADQVGRWVEAGYAWALRADIEKFFDNIRPDLLLDKLRAFVEEADVALLSRIVRAKVFDHDALIEPVSGIAQGSPLSPLLANLYLADMDRKVAAGHPRYLRYCDDLIVMERLEVEVVEARALVQRELAAAGLSLNERKTKVARVEDGFDFLGYRFGPTGKGPAVKTLGALRFRLDEIARAEAAPLDDLDALFRGWTAYYGLRKEAWIESAVGILALLRQHRELTREELVEKVSPARWALGGEAPWLGSALAAAWRANGLEEFAWMELARECGKGRTPIPDAWSRMLGVPAAELGALAGRLAGRGTEDALSLLAEAATSAGRYEVAARLSALQSIVQAPPIPAAMRTDAADAGDYEVLERWFQGRDGVHAVEHVNRGHRRFIPDHRLIQRDDWRAHLRGERTMALPLLRADRTTFFGVFDIDVERRELEQRLSRVDDLLGRALGAALRLRTALRARGIEPLLEFSGHKGYHLWVRFDEAVPAANVRSLLYGLIERAGALPEGIRVEVFPNRDRAAQGTIGPVVKLPLGIHGRTGKRCDLVGEDGKPIADPFAVLGATPFAPSAVARDRQPPAATVTAAPVPTPALGPRAIKIVEGCRVIAHLKDKVEATSYLDHGERTLLLCTLGHLGTEGAEALHALIGRTFNYRKEVTDRHIGKLPSHPISCGRIRERWPNLTAAHPCACPMAPRGGGYPTPLLFALRASQIPAFRARKPAGDMQATVPSAESATGVSTGAPPKPHGANTTVSQAEALLGRIAELRRQERGIASAAARARAELLALFDATGADALDVTAGTLRRTRAADGSWRFLIEI